MSKDDAYTILNVSQGASEEEVKRAYKKRARELHPDRNPHNPEAQADFVRLVKAYEALTSEEEGQGQPLHESPVWAEERPQSPHWGRPSWDITDLTGRQEPEAEPLLDPYRQYRRQDRVCSACHGRGKIATWQGPWLTVVSCPRCTRKRGW